MSEYNGKIDSYALDTIKEDLLNTLKEEAKKIGANISSCNDNIPCIKEQIRLKKEILENASKELVEMLEEENRKRINRRGSVRNSVSI